VHYWDSTQRKSNTGRDHSEQDGFNFEEHLGSTAEAVRDIIVGFINISLVSLGADISGANFWFAESEFNSPNVR
jgi:hypothetical protein